ncbi:MAG: DMT family transporter [Pseudomonadota bacterium]
MRAGDRSLLGIAYINVAVIFYALQDGLVRYLTADYPVLQIQFVRSAVMMSTMLVIIVSLRRFADLRPRRLGLLMFRGYTSLIGVALMYLVLANMALADAFTIFMTGPIFIALFGIPILKEKVGLTRAIAIGVGFIGVVVIMEPGSGVATQWAIVALLGAAIYGLAMVTTRDLTKSESSLTIVLFTNLFVVAVLLPVQPFIWVVPPLTDLVLLLAVGALATLAQFLLAQAYRHASAATVAPFDYVAFIYVVIVGYLMFGEVPTWQVGLGAAILIASGLVMVRHERGR